jgi:hypothetical protein
VPILGKFASCRRHDARRVHCNRVTATIVKLTFESGAEVR